MRRWLFVFVLATTPALAQTPAERAVALNQLLDALKAAPSAEAAAPLEAQIMQRLVQAGSPVVTLLMSRGLREMQANSNQEAIQDFSDAITLDPSLAEAYHQRAKARFAAGDTQGAIADIEQTLDHQPRNSQRCARSPRSPNPARTGRAPTPPGRNCWRLIRGPRAARTS